MTDPLQIELALDLLEAELAAELPAHMRAFARAHAEGRSPPSAPLVAQLASSLATARLAADTDAYAERGLALLRLLAPLAIESDPQVTLARAAAVTWAGLGLLATARDHAAARAKLGAGAIAALHRLHGTGSISSERPPAELLAPVAGWRDREPAIDAVGVADAWQAIAARLGVSGALRIDRSRNARPRCFVVEPRVEVIVVVPEVVDSQAARFAVLHELGHAAAALVLPGGIPRAVDEAAAAYVARLAESSSWLPAKWASPLAGAARARRAAIAMTLDAIERVLPAASEPTGEAPPWALWHDPGAQAAYVAAEHIADRMRAELGGNPPRGQFARALAAEWARIDPRADVTGS